MLEVGNWQHATGKKPAVVEWVPLQKHPVFLSPRPKVDDDEMPIPPRSCGGVNLSAWHAAKSRLYLWDTRASCIHGLHIRFSDTDASSSSSSSSSVLVEATSSSEKLVPDKQINFTIRNISLNVDGSSLLFVGSDGLSVMYLYERTYSHDDVVKCRTVLVGTGIFSVHNKGLDTLQASWHPDSSTHLGILSSDSVLRIYDLSTNLEDAEQEFYLQAAEPGRCQRAASICPVAFSFGGHHLWERFSVFILFSDGALFVICPFVPFGSLCKQSHVEEIYKDVKLWESNSSLPEAVNSGLAALWLETTFPDLTDRSQEGDKVSIWRAQPYAPLHASVALQGPLAEVCHGGPDDNPDICSTDSQGKAVDILYSSIGKDSVFVIAWSNGQLQIEALADEVQPLWNVHNSSRIHVDPLGRILGVAMICESNSRELSPAKLSQALIQGKCTPNTTDTVWSGYPPPLLRLAVVDLALPKCAVNTHQLSLISDPLVSERFFCLHGGGVDLIKLNFLPFSCQPEMDRFAKAPSVYSILDFGNDQCNSFILTGFAIVDDSYGLSQVVGVTSSYECIILETKGWNQNLPLCSVLDDSSADSMENSIPELISKELLSGPKVLVVPPPTTHRPLLADSIEGRSALHHYAKIFHENYVEYAHKVYIELKPHGDHMRTMIHGLNSRANEAKQKLLNFEKKEAEIKNRIDRAFQVCTLLECRLHSFKKLSAVKKKPLSRAEREFKTQLERFGDIELDVLSSSIDALKARLKRYAESSQVIASSTQRQVAGRKKNDLDGQMLPIKSSLGKLSSVNKEAVEMVKLIEHELKIHDK